MDFNKDSNPMNAAPKEHLPPEKGKSNEKKPIETFQANHHKEEMKASENPHHRAQQQPDRRLSDNAAPILNLQGNQKIAVGPSLADPTLVPQLVPLAKMELTKDSAVGSISKDSESTQMSLAKAKQSGGSKASGIGSAHSVIIVLPERSSTAASISLTKPKSASLIKHTNAKPKSKCVRCSTSAIRDTIGRNVSNAESNKHLKSASSKTTSKVAPTCSRISSSSSATNKSKSKDIVVKSKSKTKSPRPKSKPSSSKVAVVKTQSKSNEKMEKSKTKQERQSSGTSSKKSTRSTKSSTSKPKTANGKTKANAKKPKSAESSKSTVSKTHKSHSTSKKGK